MNQIATLYRSVVAGIICAVLVLSFSVADAALLFRGVLAEHLVIAVALTVLGYLVQIVVIGSFTRLQYTHGTTQEACVVVISAMLFSMRDRVAEDAFLSTAIVMITLCSLTLGVSLWLCGFLKAGKYIRLMPFPMVAGFLAGSGMLMVSFAFAILHGEALSPLEVLQGESLPAAAKVALGFAMGGLLVVLGALRWSEYTLPLVIVFAVLGFHLVIWASPFDMLSVVALDWTMAQEAVAVTYQPLTPALLDQVDWAAIAVTSPQLLSLIVVCVFACLIKISSLEIMMRQRVDENRELRIAGYANMVGGLGAMSPGFHGLSNSSIIAKLRGNAKITAAVALVTTLLGVSLAGDTLVQMPRFVFGAILIWVGTGLIYDSLILNWRKLWFHESIIVLLISLTVVFFGYLTGLVLGVICGLVMFVTEYAKLETVRSFQSAAQLHSNVDRPKQDRDVLSQHGSSVWVVRLHSYLFFGSAARSVDQITAHLDKLDGASVTTLILDFSRVTGVDSTALHAFQRLTLRTDSGGIAVWGCGADPALVSAFEKDGNASVKRFFSTLDLALEAAENGILDRQSVLLRPVEPEPENTDLVLASLFWEHGMPLRLAAGETLLKNGEPSRGLFWLVSGVLDAQVSTDSGDIRVRRMSNGALIGEISWYLQQETSARVVVVEEASLLHLDNQAMQRLANEKPDITSLLHVEIARILASRLVDNARQLRQLG